MCKLFSGRSHRLLAQVKVERESKSEGAFTVVSGFRNIKRSWMNGADFVLQTALGERTIRLETFPTDKAAHITYVVTS